MCLQSKLHLFFFQLFWFFFFMSFFLFLSIKLNLKNFVVFYCLSVCMYTCRLKLLKQNENRWEIININMKTDIFSCKGPFPITPNYLEVASTMWNMTWIAWPETKGWISKHSKIHRSIKPWTMDIFFWFNSSSSLLR